MDVELFKKRYSEDGATYKELKKEFGISFATINVHRIRLGLPKREKSFGRFEVDERRFRELYDSRDPFFTYSEIADELGCCASLIVVLRRRLGLPDREIPSRLNIDEEKFKRMYLDPSNTYDMICEEIGICVFTLQKLKKKYNLPSRKNKSSYEEKSFIEAYCAGLSNHKLASMFGMERKTVAMRIKELNLPPRLQKKTVKETPVIEPSEPVIEPIIEQITEKKKPEQKQFLILPPTLRQLEKHNQEIAIQRAQRDYMIAKKENGFTQLLGRETEPENYFPSGTSLRFGSG